MKIKKFTFYFGLILLFLFLSRRWYLFAIISFFIALFVVEGISYLKSRKTETLNKIKDFIKSGFVFIIFVLAIWPLFRRTFLVNYSDIYSAYQIAGGLSVRSNLYGCS